LRISDNDQAAALVRLFGVPAAVEGRQIALACPQTAKMEMLRRVASCAEVVDFDVMPPTLDSLYSWFMEAR
jgi:Cu-processing system ATP-binding protein